eukprot:15121977-Heterocapsa_arctica.AAC.1
MVPHRRRPGWQHEFDGSSRAPSAHLFARLHHAALLQAPQHPGEQLRNKPAAAHGQRRCG